MDNRLEVESEQTYVVYHNKSGQIAHVHTIVTHVGAARTRAGKKQEQDRALEMAGRFGHAVKAMAVLSVQGYDPAIHQTVDPRTGKVGPVKTSRPKKTNQHSQTTRKPRSLQE
jgi:hypothetical protein